MTVTEPAVEDLQLSGKETTGVNISYNTVPDSSDEECKTVIGAKQPFQHGGHTTGQIKELDPAIELPSSTWYATKRPTFLELLIHVCAITTTTVIISINFAGLYWYDLERPDIDVSLYATTHTVSQSTKLKWFQIAAKAHESIMMASFSFILIYHVQKWILGQGLPFGFLDAPILIGAGGGVGVVSRQRFWTAFTSSRRATLLGIVLIFFIILSQVIGPSSAIAMIPSLAWWPTTRLAEVWIAANLTAGNVTPWPDFQSPEDWDFSKDYECFGSESWDDPDCPAAGHNEIDAWMMSNMYFGVPTNLTMSELYTNTLRTLLTRPFDSEKEHRSPGRTVTTTVTAIDAAALGGMWQFIKYSPLYRAWSANVPSFSSAGSPIYDPVVYTECYSTWQHRDQNQSSEIHVPPMNVPWDPASPNPSGTVLRGNDTKLVSDPYNKPGFKWHMIDNMTAFATINVPVEVSYENGSASLAGYSTVTCAVDARWIPAEISMEPRDSLVVKSNLSDLRLFTEYEKRHASATEAKSALSHTLGLPHQRRQRILLPQPWLDSLDIETVQNGSMTKRMAAFMYGNTFETYDNNTHFFLSWPTDPRAANESVDGLYVKYVYGLNQFFSTWIGATIADGLARHTATQWMAYLAVMVGDEEKYVDLQHWNTTGDLTSAGTSVLHDGKVIPMAFKQSRYGYGYGFKSSDTSASVKAAVAVLSLFILIVVVQFFYLIGAWARGKYMRFGLWTEIQGLVTLGVNSQAKEYFRDSVDEAKQSKRYGLRVRISEEDRLKFVFEEDNEISHGIVTESKKMEG
jgi:hypothetical protein